MLLIFFGLPLLVIYLLFISIIFIGRLVIIFIYTYIITWICDYISGVSAIPLCNSCGHISPSASLSICLWSMYHTYCFIWHLEKIFFLKYIFVKQLLSGSILPSKVLKIILCVLNFLWYFFFWPVLL